MVDKIVNGVIPDSTRVSGEEHPHHHRRIVHSIHAWYKLRHRFIMRQNRADFIGCRRPSRTGVITYVIIVALCTGAFFGSLLFAADPIQEFRLAMPGYEYVFPRDHGAHDDFRTEWWYYTGHLTTKNGRRFGYQLTFFRRAIPRDQVKTLPSRWSVTQ